MPKNQEPKTDGFWRTMGHRIHDGLKRFRALVERYRWLTIVYKLTVALVGGVIIIAGIAMLVLPGPGWLTIFFGLALLGTEFVWARKAVGWLRKIVTAVLDRWRRYRASKKAAKNRATDKEHENDDTNKNTEEYEEIDAAKGSESVNSVENEAEASQKDDDDQGYESQVRDSQHQRVRENSAGYQK